MLYEFWVVGTRPAGENGMGLSVAEVRDEISRIKRLFLLLPDTPAVLPIWEELVAEHEVKGKDAHDARLVAAMRAHGADAILTFNGKDFERFAGIVVLTPQTLVRPKPSNNS